MVITIMFALRPSSPMLKLLLSQRQWSDTALEKRDIYIYIYTYSIYIYIYICMYVYINARSVNKTGIGIMGIRARAKNLFSEGRTPSNAGGRKFLLQKEIPYSRRKSLILEGNPFLWKEIPTIERDPLLQEEIVPQLPDRGRLHLPRHLVIDPCPVQNSWLSFVGLF